MQRALGLEFDSGPSARLVSFGETMTQYIIRRVILMIPTLIGVSLLVTAFLRLLPGDAVDILVTENSVGGGNQAFIALVDDHLREQGLDPATASFGDRNRAENEIIAGQDRLKQLAGDAGVDTSDEEALVAWIQSGLPIAQRLEIRNELALKAFKDDIRRKLGIDQNYIEQWSEWMWNALRGDLGKSIVGSETVRDELERRIPVSFELGLLAMIFGALIAIPVGVISAVKQDTWVDYSTRSFAIGALALPSFFLATLVIAFAIAWFGYSFPIFYKEFWDDPATNLEMVLVPALILGASLAGTLMRLTRAQMLEVLRQDYIRTARAKGLVARRVIITHAVRNAMLPVVTILGLQVPVLIGGSLVLEAIFGIPGIAQYLYFSLLNRDFPAIIGVNMVIATLIVVTNLVVDVMYAYLDPRVQFA
jgi:peptide/nickel transport system permease protein